MVFRSINFSAFSAACFVVAYVVAAGSASAASPNEEVARFCQANLGQKVGSGECADLATLALRAAGGKTPRDFQDHPGAGDYVWGELVAAVEVANGKRKLEGRLAAVQAGDIIQYRDAVFKGKFPGGTYTAKAAHHTSVLMAVAPNGRDLKVWEQNRSGQKIVSVAEVRLGDLKEGWVRIYRPSAAEDGNVNK